jgi:CheY-like chemotaxis protein
MGAATSTTSRILVVDDHQDIRDFMQAALEAAGYDVHTAPEGARALAAQRSQPADVLITDIFMPGKEGFETISRFKSEFPQIRIIVMSAGNVPGMTHDFLAGAGLLGVAATLRKPFTADQLLDTVRQALQA